MGRDIPKNSQMSVAGRIIERLTHGRMFSLFPSSSSGVALPLSFFFPPTAASSFERVRLPAGADAVLELWDFLVAFEVTTDLLREFVLVFFPGRVQAAVFVASFRRAKVHAGMDLGLAMEMMQAMALRRRALAVKGS